MPFLPSRFARAALRGLIALLAVTPLRRAAAQGTPAAGAPRTGSVSGIVYDSLSRRPLAAAVVQLANADSLTAPSRSMTTDSLGRFLFPDVPRGRFLLGFLHPMLDSVGIEATPRAIETDGASAIRRDLAIPSPATLRSGICGAEAAANGDALIMGFVRRVSDMMAVDSATVNVQWIEMTLERGSFSRSIATRAASTQESGWYAVCGAPSEGTVLLRASRLADSTESLELEVPKDGFLRRDLYFGVARVAGAGAGTAVVGDSLPAVRRTGDGRLSGIVVGVGGNEPLAGARVGLVNGPQTRSDAAGRFTLTSLPTGTRMLEVRAVGRVPVMMPVDVVEGAAPVRVAMVTLQSVLDTVRITASRGDRMLMEFNQRKKSAGTGRFLTAADVQARNPPLLTDVFRMVPGMSILRDSNGEEFITIRGSTGGQCRASVFMNGMLIRDLSATDINGFVQPRDVIGIEAYTAAAAPAQFREPTGCGTVLIWSR